MTVSMEAPHSRQADF